VVVYDLRATIRTCAWGFRASTRSFLKKNNLLLARALGLGSLSRRKAKEFVPSKATTSGVASATLRLPCPFPIFLCRAPSVNTRAGAYRASPLQAPRPKKMKKEHVNEELAQANARIASLENKNSELNAQIKSQERLSLREEEIILFHKKDGAHPKAPDYNGELQLGGRRYSVGVWKNGKCWKGKIQDKVARELEQLEKKPSGFIPAVDTK
jgi:hypothetical protein